MAGETAGKAGRNLDELAERATACILGTWSAAERSNWVLYVERTLHRAGEVVALGDEQRALDADSLVGFVDEQAGANWRHRCHYVLWEPATGRMTRCAASIPPAFGALPFAWQLRWQPSGLDKWRLLPTQEEDKDKGG